MPLKAKRDLDFLSLAPSESEREKAQRTHTMIRTHLESDETLLRYQIDTYLQGSYKNSTNVRGDSDVDMGSRTNSLFYYELSELPTTPRLPTYFGEGYRKSLKEEVQESITPASFTYLDYRRDVFVSLLAKYGTVENGNKAITVAGNSYRLDADVLPCTEFRWYYEGYGGDAAYHLGISFFATSGERIVNFPQQHFENLGEKNRRNNGKVKGVVRIMKRLRNEFEEAGRWDRKRSPSFYLESLIYNVPDDWFVGGYAEVLQNVIVYLHQDLPQKRHSPQLLESYVQANEIFHLFYFKFWNVNDAIDFLDLIWGAAFE